MFRSLILIAFIAFSSGFQPALSAQPSVVTDFLKISSSEPLRTAGSYTRAGSTVLFSASDDALGRRTLRVRVNKVVLDAAEDENAGTVWMDGHGQALFAEDRLALLDLTNALAIAWEDDIQLGQLPRHRDLLFRHLLYWSEAPVGLPLRRLEAKLQPTVGIFNSDQDEPDGLVVDPRAASSTASCTSFTSKCPVYRGNCVSGWRPDLMVCKQGKCAKGKTCYRCDNTLTYLSGCDFKSVSDICHDADGSVHCFECESLQVGCNKDKECIGRCGPGCGPSSCLAKDGKDGEGTYTKDCAEHDRCCREHGGCFSFGNATHCGDEYMEAYDDTVGGKCTCTGCFKP